MSLPRIMKLFMDNPGRALSREDILNSVWGRDYFGELKIVDVNIRIGALRPFFAAILS